LCRAVFDVRRLALNLIPMLLSLSVHEFCHAWAADRLGDRTPRIQGRLTLSPLAHYDVLGTFIIPAVATMMSGFALIGWAKPVQFVPANLTRRFTMRQGAALVAIAGPASNLMLAVLSAATLAVMVRVSPGAIIGNSVGELLNVMVILNIGLCIFNLLPMPPLDGSYLLPRSFDQFKASIAPYSFLLILILLNIRVVREYLFDFPVFGLRRLLGSLFGV
jgi:Zn-dependent protease